MGRRIAVFSNNGTRETIENSEFTTWGELKAHLNEKGLWNDSMQAVVKGTRATLSLEKAVLPETEFTLFLVPGKMKSGARAKTVDSISELGLRDLKKLLKHANYRGKANDKKSIMKYLRTKGYGKMSVDAINEIVLTKAAKAKAEAAKAPAANEVAEATECTKVSVDVAKSQIKVKLNCVKEDILAILENVKLETVQQGVDLFEGLEEEFNEIAKEIKG